MTPETHFAHRKPFFPFATKALCCVLSLTGICFATSTFGQNTEDPLLREPRTERILGKRERVEEEPQASDGLAEDFGVPYSRMMRDAEPPYENLFRDFKLRGDVETKLGPAAANFHGDFFRGIKLSTPLSTGIRPETAELKLGNLYVDLQSSSFTLLFSDNVNQTEINRESGVLMATRLNAGVMYQLGDNFRLGIRGAIVYFPLKGRIGVSGFGLDDFLSQFVYRPLFDAQIAYDIHAGNWEIQLIDDFLVQHRRWGDDLDFELFEGATFEEQDVAGRYRLSAPRFTHTRPSVGRDNRLGTDLIELRNQAGGIATRMLPTDTRAELGAFHENIWYANRRNEANLPHTHDFAFANLINEHENMRFKPYAHYKASHYDTWNGWNHRVLAGIHGPITDYISFLAEGGYYWNDGTGRNTPLVRVRLDHNPTPLIYQSLQYAREVTEPDRDLRETWTYRLRYKINGDLYAEGFAQKERFDDLDNSLSGSDGWRGGLRFTYRGIKNTLLQIGAVYHSIDSENPSFGERDIWTARVDVHYRHSEAFDSHLLYRYQIRDSSVPLDSYYEHLLIYTLTRYF